MVSTTLGRYSNPMNVARQADGLLSAAKTIALLELLGQSSVGLTVDQVAHDLCVQHAASHSRTRNSIIMLRSAGLLTRSSDRLVLVAGLAAGWRVRIGAWVAERMSERLATTGAHALRLYGGHITLDPMQLPGPVDGLPLWLTEFGVASRSGFASRQWVIAKDYEEYFMGAARSWNRSASRRISQAALEVRLEQQAEDGAEAEEWVLDRERRRLSSHPLLDQIVRTSIEDAAAGFDISSFSTCNTIIHDRFLEVKSYSGRRRFFWTRNEIATAKRLGEAYHLCVINRDRMGEDDYEPEVISAPYAALVETDHNGWLMSPATFECLAIED